MKITLRLHGQLRALAGNPPAGLEIPAGSTLLGLLRHAGDGGDPALARMMLTEAGAIRPSVRVMVNDENAVTDRPLREGDEVLVFAAIAGG